MNQETNFNNLPLVTKNRLLAAHLKTHMNIVEELSKAFRELEMKYFRRARDTAALESELRSAKEELQLYQSFVARHGLKKAYMKFKIFK
jgi:hypothetical protein